VFHAVVARVEVLGFGCNQLRVRKRLLYAGLLVLKSLLSIDLELQLAVILEMEFIVYFSFNFLSVLWV